jgi:pyruvate formate lyase activating enzyme
MLRVHSIETFGTHEGPGIRLVIFLQGCPLKCVYCHNPDTQAFRTDKTEDFHQDQIIELLEHQRPYFKTTGGLTVSGGEPTMQAGALIDLFKLAKTRKFNLVLDTNGTIYNDQINKLYDLTDLVILDVKHFNPTWHRKVTGGSLDNVLKNAHYREQSGKPMWLRYVLVPGWTDQQVYLKQWAKYFSRFKTVERVEILPYHTLGVHKYEALNLPYVLKGIEPPTTEQVKEAGKIFEQYLNNVIVA